MISDIVSEKNIRIFKNCFKKEVKYLGFFSFLSLCLLLFINYYRAIGKFSHSFIYVASENLFLPFLGFLLLIVSFSFSCYLCSIREKPLISKKIKNKMRIFIGSVFAYNTIILIILNAWLMLEDKSNIFHPVALTCIVLFSILNVSSVLFPIVYESNLKNFKIEIIERMEEVKNNRENKDASEECHMTRRISSISKFYKRRDIKTNFILELIFKSICCNLMFIIFIILINFIIFNFIIPL